MRTILMLGAAGLVLAGCNTVQGFGRDLSATGNAISSAAQDAKGKPTAKKHSVHRTASQTACTQQARNAGNGCTG